HLDRFDDAVFRALRDDGPSLVNRIRLRISAPTQHGRARQQDDSCTAEFRFNAPLHFNSPRAVLSSAPMPTLEAHPRHGDRPRPYSSVGHTTTRIRSRARAVFFVSIR